MLSDDQILLDSFERLFCVLEEESKNLKNVKSIHAERILLWEKEIRAYARIFEEISLPARLILEHILELKHKGGQMAIEAENISQSHSPINDVGVEEFGVITIHTGIVKLTWRDSFYNYLLYPDKVELRAQDEKTAIKLFFSHVFGEQDIHKFSAVTSSEQLLYIHPTLQKLIDKNQE